MSVVSDESSRVADPSGPDRRTLSVPLALGLVALTVAWFWTELTTGSAVSRTASALGVALCPGLCLSHIVVPTPLTPRWRPYLAGVVVVAVLVCAGYWALFGVHVAQGRFTPLALGVFVVPPMMVVLVARHRRHALRTLPD